MFAAAPNASAQGYGDCNGGGWGWGGYDMGYLYNSLDYNVPYFAAHPPVYYSYPCRGPMATARSRIRPNVMTPEVVMGDDAAGRDHQSVRAEHRKRPTTSADQSAAAAPKNQPAAAAGDHQSVRRGQRAIAQAGE